MEAAWFRVMNIDGNVVSVFWKQLGIAAGAPGVETEQARCELVSVSNLLCNVRDSTQPL